jgi:hypothetical protein
LALREACESSVFPEASQAWALLGFNLGVELGQIAIVAGLALCGYVSLRLVAWRNTRATIWANAALCGLGCYWFFQRLYF